MPNHDKKRLFLLSFSILILFFSSCQTVQYRLETQVVPDGSGTVTSKDGIFEKNRVVTISANPSKGFRFSHWGGDAKSESSTINLVMDSNKKIIANFVARFSLNIAAFPEGTGRISPESGVYDDGNQIILTAIPDEGYIFIWWDGISITDNKSNPARETITKDLNIIAHFQPKYSETEIDLLIKRLSSSEEEQRLNAVSALKTCGNILSEEQINQILDIMRRGETSWITRTWKDETCAWNEITTVQYYAAEVIQNIKSSYVTQNNIDEAGNVKNTSKTEQKVKPGST